MTEEASEEDRVRAELVGQLRESLARERTMMLNEKLDVKTRERWTQMHTNTAQVLNQILRDRQFKEWEKRLRELEARGRILNRTTNSSENSELDSQTGTDSEEPNLTIGRGPSGKEEA